MLDHPRQAVVRNKFIGLASIQRPQSVDVGKRVFHSSRPHNFQHHESDFNCCANRPSLFLRVYHVILLFVGTSALCSGLTDTISHQTILVKRNLSPLFLLPCIIGTHLVTLSPGLNFLFPCPKERDVLSPTLPNLLRQACQTPHQGLYTLGQFTRLESLARHLRNHVRQEHAKNKSGPLLSRLVTYLLHYLVTQMVLPS
jgi:hypothetical protein